jgi:DNA-binding response OmpR family regulator
MNETDFSGVVLVVSDDPHLTQEATLAFSENVRIELAGDARQAQKILETVVPDVVVVDIQTGSAGGFSLCREMIQTTRLRDVPVLMLLERSQDEWLARQAGAHAIKVKPIEVDDLVTAVVELATSHSNAA